MKVQEGCSTCQTPSKLEIRAGCGTNRKMGNECSMWQTSKNGKCIGSFRGTDHLCVCVCVYMCVCDREREIITVKIITEVPCKDVDWIEPVQDTVRRYILVKEITNIRVPHKARNFL